MVIGELIDALQKGNYPEDSVAVGMAKLRLRLPDGQLHRDPAQGAGQRRI